MPSVGSGSRIPPGGQPGEFLVKKSAVAYDTTWQGPSPVGYRHAQTIPGTVWVISHALGYDPAGLTVISADGDTIDGAVVQYLAAGQTLRLSFDISLAGTAYLS